MKLNTATKQFVRISLVLTAVIFFVPRCFSQTAEEQAYKDRVKGSTDAAESLRGWNVNLPTDAQGRVIFGVSNVSRTGGSSLTIQVDPNSPVGGFYEFYKDVNDVKPGDVYEMTAWIKTENQINGAGAYMGIGALEPNYPYHRFVSGESERLLGTSDWTQARCVLFVPKNVHTIRQIILISGTGQAYFDDIEFKKIKTLQAADSDKVSVEVTNEVTTDEFIGFGYEDDAFFYTDENFRHGITEQDVKLRSDRIADLSPGVIATLFWWDTISPTHDVNAITYDTELMRALIRTLRPHQEAGRQVFMGDVHWGWTKDNFAYNQKNVERGAKAYADVVKYLVKEQGLTCLKYICVSGEVDMTFEALGGSFETYLKACRILRQELDKAGLQDVKIIGDKSGGFVWIDRIIPILDDIFGIYTIHEYPDVTQYPLIDYRIDRIIEIVQNRSMPIETANGKKYKPVFLYEIGALEGKTIGIPEQMYSVTPTYEYGLFCANTAISGLNRGVVGGSVWCLHSMYYPGQSKMNFGTWEFKDKGWEIRPNYYGFGLFSKYARAGMKPLKVKVQPHLYDVSAAALKDAAGHYIVYLLNLSDKVVNIEVSGVAEGRYDVYEYSRDNIPSMQDADYGKVDALKTDRKWNSSEKKITLRPESIVLLK